MTQRRPTVPMPRLLNLESRDIIIFRICHAVWIQNSVVTHIPHRIMMLKNRLSNAKRAKKTSDEQVNPS